MYPKRLGTQTGNIKRCSRSFNRHSLVEIWGLWNYHLFLSVSLWILAWAKTFDPTWVHTLCSMHNRYSNKSYPLPWWNFEFKLIKLLAKQSFCLYDLMASSNSFQYQEVSIITLKQCPKTDLRPLVRNFHLWTRTHNIDQNETLISVLSILQNWMN